MIVLSILNGSRLYGTNRKDSDYDVISVYQRHRRDYYFTESYRIHNNKFTLDNGKVIDVVYVDFLQFCKFLIRGNPNFLIPMMIWKPIYTTEIGDLIKAHLPYFLDYDNIKNSFEGMLKSLNDPRTGREQKDKNAAKFIRELYKDFLENNEFIYKEKCVDMTRIKNFIDIMMKTCDNDL